MQPASLVLVDDEPLLSQGLKKVLGQRGWSEVLLATSYDQGLKMAAVNRPVYAAIVQPKP